MHLTDFSDTRPPDDYRSNPYNGDGGGYPPSSAPAYDDYPDSRPYPGEMEQPYYPEDDEMVRHMGALNMGAPPGEGYHPDDRRTPSIDGRPPGEWSNYMFPCCCLSRLERRLWTVRC